MYRCSLIVSLLLTLALPAVAALELRNSATPFLANDGANSLRAWPAISTLLLDSDTVVVPAPTYSIAATVTGLGSGKTLVLKNSNQQTLSFGSNSAAAFATKLASGVSYAVTVKTQPTGQTCTVSNGSGIIASSNISNISVACVNSASNYSIAATVSGLGSGKTVQLQNNYLDPVTVASNGAITFATALANGTSYMVSVKTQPVGQTCSVTNGAGLVAGANVNASVTCSNDSAGSYSVSAAVSGLMSGNSLVIRLERSGSNVAQPTITSNGQITFVPRFSSGQSYYVPVISKPVDQTCTVDGGYGEIAQLNVSDVKVVCAPDAPIGLTLVQKTSTTLALSWTASPAHAQVVRYDILIHGQKVASTTNTTFTLSNLTPATSYPVSVQAVDSNSHPSPGSETLTRSTDKAAQSAYAVAVNVRGLDAGATLQLKNNGADTLSAVRNGQHTFATSLANNAAYAVTVTGLPRGQQCAVSNGSGNIAASDVANVFVQCTHVASTPLSIASDGSAPWALAVLRGAAGLRNKAYPGILYESRIGVTGGIFPYEFSVAGLTKGGVAVDASGVHIDFRRGLVRWTPATTGSYVLTVAVKDSKAGGATSLQQAFPIEVTSSGFVFVSAANGVDTVNGGTFNQPYQSVQYTLAHAASSAMIYVRNGRYATNGFSLNANSSVVLLAYPNEKVTLDLQDRSISYAEDTRTGRLEGFDILNARQRGIFIDSSRGGLVIRNNRFLNGREYFNGEAGDVGISENPCYIFPAGGDSTRHPGLMVQDNYFGPFEVRSWLAGDGTTRTSGGSSMVLYDVANGLIENNLVETKTYSGISDKDNSVNNTFRENIILGPADGSMGNGFSMMAQSNASGLHMHHNLLENSDITLGAQCFQTTCVMEKVFLHHNTLAQGRTNFAGGPYQPGSNTYRFWFNVVSNNVKAPFSGCSGEDNSSMLAKWQIDKNLYKNNASLVLDNDWCPSTYDANLTRWRNTLGFDINGTFTTSTILTGSGETTGVPTNGAWFGVVGHGY